MDTNHKNGIVAENTSNGQNAARNVDGTRRVVITGMGAISPAGAGVGALWQKVMAKECCIGELTRFDTTDFSVKVAAQIPAYDPIELGLSKKETRRFARFVQYAMIAADEAIAQSGLDFSEEDTTRIGCSFGSGIGGLEDFEDGCRTLHSKGPRWVSPLLIPTMISNMAAGNLSIRYGLRGECLNVVTACATGTHSIGQAYRSIRHGYLDAALAGGTEEAITPIAVAGFGNLGALTKSADPLQASMPFDVRRSGFVAGEGAGALVLESLEHALSRGANILGEVAGFGSTGDAYHMTSPEPTGEGVIRAMRQALDEAGMTPGDIGHLNAHGTSTSANDKTESAALIGLCGEAGHDIPVVSVKGSTGHMLGAAGAIEAIVTVLSVVNACVPATTGFSQPDPECPVRVLTEPLENYPQKVALSNSLGFGGHNASLAVKAYEG